MFIVLNKEKIGLYMILLSTVVILFGLAFNMNATNTIETSTNVEQKHTNIEIVNSLEHLE